MSRLRAFLASYSPSRAERPILATLGLGLLAWALLVLAFGLYLLLGGPVPGAPNQGG